MDDLALLRDYARNGSETAFATLVSRYAPLVHSAALRQTRDPQVAGEVTQAVFIILAQKSGRVSGDTVLSGWLFKTTRFVALAQTRAVVRRRHYEQESHMPTEDHPITPEAPWEQIAPLLDEALAHLGEKDRQALLWRYFENRSLAEIGGSLGAGEDAVRMRINRALGKLRNYFTKRGIVVTTAMIAGVMSANAVQAAPAGLVQVVTAAGVAKGAAASGSILNLSKGTLKIMAWTKVKMAIVAGAGILLAAGTATVTVKEIATQRTPAWQESFDVSVLDSLPLEVVILPSRPATIQNNVHAVGGLNGKALGLGQTVPNLLEEAYNVIESRLILNAPMPGGKYDFVDTYAVTAESMQGLQAAIKKRFALTAREEMIETNVLILTVQSTAGPGLKGSTSRFSNHVTPEAYAIQGATIYTLAADLETTLVVAMIDETGLKRALREQLGLTLTPGLRTLRYVVVDKVE